MNKEHLENGSGMENAQKENTYQRYSLPPEKGGLGGIINETDYNHALERADETTSLDEIRIKQVQNIAKYAGVELVNPEGSLDKRTVLYGVLREDINKGIHHHSQMSDQQIFVEALRMLGDSESVDKMVKAYPNISFQYKRKTGK